jgi:hypothetical protein
MSNDTTFEITFRLSGTSLPTVEEQYLSLWRLAQSLQGAGLPIDGWYPPAETPEASMLNKAFDSAGPTPAAIAMAKAAGETYPGVRGLGAWNGIEGDGGIVFTDNLVVAGPCTCSVDSTGIPGLQNPKTVAGVVADVTSIWPASSIQVGPYKYFSQQQVFEHRVGAGWMLYLPRTLTARQVPEAGALVPVMEDRKQKGTIVVSIADETFSSENPQHVKVANSIEVRLADQGLLPLFTDL